MTGHDLPAAMRASDADRDAVVSDLSEHFQAGRLTKAEFDERTGQARAARPPACSPAPGGQVLQRPAAAVAPAGSAADPGPADRPGSCRPGAWCGHRRMGADLAARARTDHRAAAGL